MGIELHQSLSRRALLSTLIVLGMFVASQGTSAAAVHFGTDIVPILTKLGCNGGGCHGKATGQNGFKLSLLGFEPHDDYESLVTEGRGRRISLTTPDSSLLLVKATSRVPHGGGRRLSEDSDDYRLLRKWIVQGTRAPLPSDPQLVRIELHPLGAAASALNRDARKLKSETTIVLATDATMPLQTIAHFSNGTSRDVTRQAIYQSNEPTIASVDIDGVIKTTRQHGLVAVMARFGDQIATIHAAVPFVTNAERLLDNQQRIAALNQFASAAHQTGVTSNTNDRLIESSHPANAALIRQWLQLGVGPSAVTSDTNFLRRVTLDICGTLPTRDELHAFRDDTRSDKRARLIDRLLDRPEYASYFALKWADVLQNRGAGYSTSKQRTGTTLFAGWIRDSLANNKPYDQFVTDILTASGSQYENPPALWYRTVRKSPEYVESVAQAFLGIRIQCAQCHHHPTERWSQSDYFGLAANFARVGRKGGFADAEVPTDEIIFLKQRGDVLHPRTGERLLPRPLGGSEFRLNSEEDPRVSLARWLTNRDNPYFARTMANRLWAHFMGRGIVHPIDDARSTNPPSNPELLDALATDFAENGFNLKRLIRNITLSHAYQLDAAPHSGNAGDSQTFSRFYPRRLSAEVLLDAMSQVLDVPTNFPGVPAGTRAIELPDENVAAHFLDVFGRPARMSACECERVDSPALTQALELVNSTEIQRKLTAKTGYVQQLADGKNSYNELAIEIFERLLSRRPNDTELKAASDFLASEPDRAEACRSLIWSLLATNEFLFNH